MRHPLALAVSLALVAHPLAAQQPPEDAPGFLERGLGAIIGQLFGRAETDPAEPLPGAPSEGLADGLAQGLRQMAPVLRDMATQIDDVRNYQAPERLPNGDILIRRREGAPPPPPLGDSLRPDEPALPGESDAPGIPL